MRRGTPIVALAATGLLVVLILLVLPDVSAAGAAASLIFLITFALVHGVAILVGIRSVRRPPPFRIPLFPVVPVIGGLACVALAVFQGIAVPLAGIDHGRSGWVSGGILFISLFARRARRRDAANTRARSRTGHAARQPAAGAGAGRQSRRMLPR